MLETTRYGGGRLAALRALGEIGDARSDAALVAVLRARDTEFEYRQAAAVSLAKRGVREILPDLVRAINDPVEDRGSSFPPPERMTVDIACEALGWMGGDEAIRRRLHVLSTDRRPCGPAREAALALGRLRVAEAVPELRRVLREHRESWTREAAGSALWEITEAGGEG
ncbi:MAG: HEAT repeat domain-containing protein [Planctomycetes bacterium]|nr:HEAT repeat domain-containing protein [Planctomycetota bacterium]